MTTDQILSLAIKSLKSAMPEALYNGSMIKQTRVFDASKSIARIVEDTVTPIEIVFDSFKAEEIIGSNILSTDVKLHIIANNVKSIDFYNVIRVNGSDYSIKNKLETVIGAKIALFTIVAQL